MDSVITMRGLCKSYKKQEVLHDFSLTVEHGHICGLIGCRQDNDHEDTDRLFLSVKRRTGTVRQ